MKKEELYRALEYVRDEYIDSAADAMAGKSKKRQSLRYLGIAAACVALVGAIVALPMAWDRVPVYDDAYFTADDLAEVFGGPAVDGPTNQYTTVSVPDASYLSLKALPEEEYLPIYQYSGEVKEDDEKELISFAEKPLFRLTEALGKEQPEYEINTNVALVYEPVDWMDRDHYVSAYQHAQYNYITCGADTDTPTVIDGEQIAVRQKQSDEEIIESLASVKEKLFDIFGVSFDDAKVVREFDGYSTSGVQYLDVYFYNFADHRLNQESDQVVPYSDYIRLEFDNDSNFEGDQVSDDLPTEVKIQYRSCRFKPTELRSVVAQAKLLPLEEAEKLLEKGYVFGGHSCELCMAAQDKVDFTEYDYVSLSYIFNGVYDQPSKGFPFYAFYKKIGRSDNGNEIYAKTYVPAIEVSGLDEYFAEQTAEHQAPTTTSE